MTGYWTHFGKMKDSIHLIEHSFRWFTLEEGVDKRLEQGRPIDDGVCEVAKLALGTGFWAVSGTLALLRWKVGPCVR
jgi:hypothetical protein